MKPPVFKYFAVGSLEDALDLKAQWGDEAKFLAGGQSLVPAMNFRMAQPAVLIDLNSLVSLDYVRRVDQALQIGAMTRYCTLQRCELVARHQPLLREALPHVAHPQIRNRGTLGGNLSHADPASEMPAIVVALGGRMRARSVRGERCIHAKDFFVGPLTTDLANDEMLTEIELPDLPANTGTCFLEIARRRGDYALMGIASTLSMGSDGICVDARLAFCSAGETPKLVASAGGLLIGSKISDIDIEGAAENVQRSLQPLGSVHASSEFQRHLAGVLTRRAVRLAHLRVAGDNG